MSMMLLAMSQAPFVQSAQNMPLPEFVGAVGVSHVLAIKQLRQADAAGPV